jgi:hypothetical protein
MKEASLKTNPARLAIAIIIAHAAVAFLHAAAHQVLDIRVSTAQLIFILTVIMLSPLVAGLLLWKRLMMAGGMLLAAAMLGSLLFGVYNHFMALSPDHVSHVGGLPQKSWPFIFQATASLLALIEMAGSWVGFRTMKKSFLSA